MPKEPLKRLVKGKSHAHILTAIIDATFHRLTCTISFNPDHTDLITEPECHDYCNKLREALSLLTVEQLEIYCHTNNLTEEVNSNLNYIRRNEYYPYLSYPSRPCAKRDISITSNSVKHTQEPAYITVTDP